MTGPAGAPDPAGDACRTVVRDAWRRVLGHDDFTDDDSFFDAGGHSLRGVLLMKRLSGRFGVPLPVSLLFDHQTVAELAVAIEADTGRAGGDTAPPGHPHDRPDGR